jgi:hypothetical protein
MMNSSSSVGRSRKRSRKEKSLPEETETKLDTLCSFCRNAPAAVTVKPPTPSSSRRSNLKPPPAQPFCVLHYYTTSAVRSNPAGVTILDQSIVDEQLVPMQELFAEAFVQLQQELSEQSARAFEKNAHDPLAILHDLNKNRRKKPPSLSQAAAKANTKTNLNDKNEGGFIRDVPLPERLLRTQQEQARVQAALTLRMNRAAAGTTATTAATSLNAPQRSKDITKRRKTTRKSVWNVVMDEDANKGGPGTDAVGNSISSQQQQEQPALPDLSRNHGVVCTCGSHDVEMLGSNTSRSQDMAKAETWGNKDRADEIVTRYRCGKCGMTWNEEE